MLQHQKSVKAVIRGQTRESTTLKAGFTKLKRDLSHSIGISRDSSQQDSTTRKMSPSHERRQSIRQSKRREGAEQRQGENEDTSNANGEASSKAGNSSAASQSSDSPGASALAVTIRKASSQLQESQEATKTLLEACDKYAKEIERFPVLSESFNKQGQELRDRDVEIQRLQNFIDVLEKRHAAKEKAAEGTVQANLKETERLQKEKDNFEQQQKMADTRLIEMEEKLKIEASKELQKEMAEQETKFQDRKKALESEMEKEKEKQSEKLAKLEKTNKEQLDIINDQAAQIAEKLLELDSKDAQNKRLQKEKDREVSENEALEAELKDLQNEFTLDSQPLESYKGKFLEISEAIKNITSRYLARDLNTQEIRKLRKKMIAADPAFSDVPFSNTELSVQLRKLHAQRVISHALHKTVWQSFSSDKSVADPMLPKFLQEMEAEVLRSGMKSHGSSRTARLWKALTVFAINPETTDIKTQKDRAQKLTPSHSPKCRTDKVIIDVLSVLEPLLDASTLPRFNLDLFDLVNKAISVWTFAQVDEQMFTICPTLDEQNKRDWTDVTSDHNSSNADVERQQEVGCVFMLFPVVIAKKNIPLPNAPRSTPGSFPEQDQQSPNIEVVHKGLGLPEHSEIVQIGKELNKRLKMAKNRVEESFTEEPFEQIKGHSRQNSTAETSSGPPSPMASWLSNGKNGFPSEILRIGDIRT